MNINFEREEVEREKNIYVRWGIYNWLIDLQY